VSRRAWVILVGVVAVIIIGSLTFLTNSGTPRPMTYGDIGTELGTGRIERPEIGFAVTTPPGWHAWEPSTRFQDWWGADEVVHLWMEPANDRAEWWMGTCGVGEACTRERMVEAGGQAYCWFVDDTQIARDGEWTGLSTPLELAAGGLSEEDGWLELSTAVEDLPSGQAGVIEVVDPNGWQQTVHHHTDGERWFRHICGVLDSDVDPRSIAESFEFLPTAG
jgi:hypothetical protein